MDEFGERYILNKEKRKERDQRKSIQKNAGGGLIKKAGIPKKLIEELLRSIQKNPFNWGICLPVKSDGSVSRISGRGRGNGKKGNESCN